MKAKCSKIVLAFAFALLVTALFGGVSAFAAERSGDINASELEANETITLTDDTVLIMDKDVTVKSIQGAHKLVVQGGKKLTVQSDAGIDVGKLVVDGAQVKANKVPGNTEKKNNAIVETKQDKAAEQTTPAPAANEGDGEDEDLDVASEPEGEDPQEGGEPEGEDGNANGDIKDAGEGADDNQGDGEGTDDENLDAGMTPQQGNNSDTNETNDDPEGTNEETDNDNAGNQTGNEGTDPAALEEESDNGIAGMDTQQEKPTTVTISFDAGGVSTSNIPAATSVEVGGTLAKPEDPQAEGLIFSGWFTDENFTKPYDFATKIAENTAPFTLFAKWSVEVKFNLNGHGSKEVPTQTIDKGQKATEPSEYTVGDRVQSADGKKWEFEGWFSDDKTFKKEFDFSQPINTNTTVYAKWSQLFTAKFDKNLSVNVENMPKDETSNADGSIAEPKETPTAEGYRFDYWYTTDATKPFDFSKPITADTTLKAKWTKTYKVTFNLNGHGSTAVPTQVIDEGKKATQPDGYKVGNPGTRVQSSDNTKWEFEGWFSDDTTFKNKFDFSKPITADTTVYAKWTQVYTVTFNMNGHGTAEKAQLVKSGNKAKNPGARSESIENNVGYEFGGWYTDQACTKAYNFDTPVTADITIYAKWTKVEYKFANGATAVTWTKGTNNSVTLTVNRNLNDDKTYDPHFKGQSRASVLIDNKVVAASNYTAAKGSLKLTFQSKYLETLSVGNHPVKVTFNDGETNPTTTLTIKAAAANQQNAGKGNTPKTGDTLPFAIVGAIAGVALVIVVVALVARKRTRKQ